MRCKWSKKQLLELQKKAAILNDIDTLEDISMMFDILNENMNLDNFNIVPELEVDDENKIVNNVVTPVSIIINNEEVLAYKNDITKYVLVGLKDSEGNWIKECSPEDMQLTLIVDFGAGDSILKELVDHIEDDED